MFRTFSTLSEASLRSVTSLLSFAGNLQLLSGNPDLPQQMEDLRWHSGRKIDRAEVIKNLNAANARTIDSRFVRDRSHDVARLHLMRVTDFDAVRVHSFFTTI